MGQYDLFSGAALLLLLLKRSRAVGALIRQHSGKRVCAPVVLLLTPLLLWKLQLPQLWRDRLKRSRARMLRMSSKERVILRSTVPDPFERLHGGMEAFETLYEVVRRITDSTYGSVFECRGNDRAHGKSVVKIVPRNNHPLLRCAWEPCKGSIGTSSRRKKKVVETDEFWTYMSRLLSLNHDNVVRYQRFFADSASFYFVMEYCVGRTLLEHLFTQPHWYELEARQVMLPLLRALSYIHRLRLVHRDVKLENLMVGPLVQAQGLTGNPDGNLKLLDFGLGSDASYAHGTVGTLGYMAPETFGSDRYGCPVDIFSAGVIMHILLTGRPAFKPPIDMRKIEDHVRELFAGPDVSKNPFQLISPTARDLMDWMLIPDATARCTADEALRHQWFRASLGSSGGSYKRPSLPLVLWSSCSSELRFLRAMGVWSGSTLGSNTSCAYGKDSLHCIKEADVESEDNFLDDLYHRVVRPMKVPVAIADPTKYDCPVVAISRGFEALTGHEEREVLGRNCRFLSMPRATEISEETRSELRDAARGMKTFLGVLPNVRADGSYFENLLHLSPIDVRGQTFVVGVQMEVDNHTVDLADHEILGNSRKVHSAIRVWLRSPAAHISWGRAVSG